MKHEITWTGKTGKTATVTVELVTERTHYADGANVTVPCCEMRIEGSVSGHGVVGYNVRRVSHPGIAGACGKLGIPAEQMDLIEAAIAEVEATPEWQAKLEREAEAHRQALEHEAGAARIERAMNR